MTENKYCRVSHCRYAWSHLTCAHLCGRCQSFGHGEIECGNHSVINDLKTQSANDHLPNQSYCTMRGCGYKWSHQSSAHHCSLCLGNHSSHDCSSQQIPVAGLSPPPSSLNNSELHTTTFPTSSILASVGQALKIECPICREVNIIAADQKKVYGIKDQCVVCMDSPCEIFLPKCGHVCLCQSCGKQLNTGETQSPQSPFYNGNSGGVSSEPVSLQLHPSLYRLAQEKMGSAQGAIYISLSAGMGCVWFIRRSSVDAALEGFFMHSDSWGQYGPATDETPQLHQFLSGYTQLLTTISSTVN